MKFHTNNILKYHMWDRISRSGRVENLLLLRISVTNFHPYDTRQRQNAVSAYFASKQILPFGFAWQYIKL